MYKLVHGNQIHLYRPAHVPTYLQLHQHTLGIFKKLPNSFTMHYLDHNAATVLLHTDQDIQQFAATIECSAKIFITKSLPFQELQSSVASTFSELKIKTKTLCKEQEGGSLQTGDKNDGLEHAHWRCSREPSEIGSEASNRKQSVEMGQHSVSEKMDTLEGITNSLNDISNEVIEVEEEKVAQTDNQQQQAKEVQIIQPVISLTSQLEHEHEHEHKHEMTQKHQPYSQPQLYQQNHEHQQQSIKHPSQASQPPIQPALILQIQIQHQAMCDQCGIYPLLNIRYKCAICDDYDLCEKCQQLSNQIHHHSHPFLKIKSPMQTPLSISVTVQEFEGQGSRLVNMNRNGNGNGNEKQQQRLEKDCECSCECICESKYECGCECKPQTKEQKLQHGYRLTATASYLSTLMNCSYEQCYKLVSRYPSNMTKQEICGMVLNDKQK